MLKQILLLLMMLLGISLSRGCSSVGSSHSSDSDQVFEQCAPTFVFSDSSQIEPEKSYCSIRQFQISRHYIGPVKGTDSKKPLSHCDRCVGFKKYTDVIGLWNDTRQELLDQEVENEKQKETEGK